MTRVLGDLAVAVGATIAMFAIAIGYGEQGGPAAIRIPLGFSFIFLLPGYAIAAALFPNTALHETATGETLRGSVSLFERLILSLGLSITVVPLIGLLLTLVGQPIGLLSIFGTLGLVIVGCSTVGAIQRLRRPPLERFYIPAVGPAATGGKTYVTRSVVNAAIVVTILLIIAGAGLALVETENEERYTELGIVTAQEFDSEAASGADTPALGTDDRGALDIEIANHEGNEVEYTVVVVQQELDGEGGGVVQTVELDRFSVSLSDGERTAVEHQPQPVLTGDQLRVTYLLYRETPPTTPTRSNAYRSVYLNVDVPEQP